MAQVEVDVPFLWLLLMLILGVWGFGVTRGVLRANGAPELCGWQCQSFLS